MEENIENCKWILEFFTKEKMTQIFNCDLNSLRIFLIDCMKISMVKLYEHAKVSCFFFVNSLSLRYDRTPSCGRNF